MPGEEQINKTIDLIREAWLGSPGLSLADLLNNACLFFTSPTKGFSQASNEELVGAIASHIGDTKPMVYKRSSRSIDMRGQRVNGWVVMSPASPASYGARWTCSCHKCGSTAVFGGVYIRRGEVGRCSCKELKANRRRIENARKNNENAQAGS